MRAGLIVLVLLSCAVSAVGERDVKGMIADLERQRTVAMVDVDKSFLNHVLANDVTYTHSTGSLQTKDELIASLEQGRIDYVSIQNEKSEVRVYGDTAVVTGIALFGVKVGAESVTARLRYTDVYVKRDGYWQMVAYQSTRIPDKAGE